MAFRWFYRRAPPVAAFSYFQIFSSTPTSAIAPSSACCWQAGGLSSRLPHSRRPVQRPRVTRASWTSAPLRVLFRISRLRSFPAGQVYAFDPHPFNSHFQRTVKQENGLERFHPQAMGLSNAEGRLMLTLGR
jgi:hypothetical protein